MLKVTWLPRKAQENLPGALCLNFSSTESKSVISGTAFKPITSNRKLDHAERTRRRKSARARLRERSWAASSAEAKAQRLVQLLEPVRAAAYRLQAKSLTSSLLPSASSPSHCSLRLL